MKYVYVLEGKIGRIEKGRTPEDITGLATDEFTSCNIIALISRDKNRYSFTHADQSLSEAIILSEIAWAGEDCHKFICRRASYTGQPPEKVGSKIMPTIQDRFTLIIVPEDKEAITIQIGAEAPMFSGSIPTCIFHPYSAILTLQHRLETFFLVSSLDPIFAALLGSNKIQSPLCYDGSSMTDYRDFSPSRPVNQGLSQHRLTGSSTPLDVYMAVKTSQWPMATAANLYGYLYLYCGNPLDLPSFLRISFQNFLLEILNDESLTRETKNLCKAFIELCMNLTEKETFIRLAEQFRSRTDIEAPIQNSVWLQCAVVINAWRIIFQEFPLNYSYI